MLPSQVRSLPVAVGRQFRAAILFTFADRGEHELNGIAELKGFEEPVRLYEVRWRS